MNLWRSCQTLSTVVALFYIPTAEHERSCLSTPLPVLIVVWVFVVCFTLFLLVPSPLGWYASVSSWFSLAFP